MTIFKHGDFISHSGVVLPFKIDCDGLTDEDVECVAEHIASKTDFGMVQGVPRGGCRLAAALEKRVNNPDAPFNILIVDDVLTTGASMEVAKAAQPPQVHPSDVVGWVVFARGELPSWVRAVFSGGDEECTA